MNRTFQLGQKTAKSFVTSALAKAEIWPEVWLDLSDPPEVPAQKKWKTTKSEIACTRAKLELWQEVWPDLSGRPEVPATPPEVPVLNSREIC